MRILSLFPTTAPVLLATLIAVAAPWAAAHAHAAEPDGRPALRGGGDQPPPGMPHADRASEPLRPIPDMTKPNIERVHRVLQLAEATDEQRARIREIWNEAQRQAGERRQAVRVLQDELLRELTRPELDPRLIETVRRKLAAESDWLSQHMTQALVNVYSVLTPVQRERVGKAMLDQARRQRERQEELLKQSVESEQALRPRP